MQELVQVPRVVRHKRAPKLGAIVGFGAIAERAHLPALRQCGLEVVAIVEPSAARQDVARAQLPEARIYSDLAGLLGREKIDFIDICTPPHLHFAAAKLALVNGLDVLCEKPLVLKRTHGKVLNRLAREHKRTLVCMHNWTVSPIIQRARELVAAGMVGEVRLVDVATLRTQPAAAAGAEADWRIRPELAGGGILFDHGWHALSMMLQLHQKAPRSVQAECWQDRYVDLEVEDTVELAVKFHEQGAGRFLGTWAADRRENRVHVVGSEGTLEILNDTLRIEHQGVTRLTEAFTQSLADGGYRVDWVASQVQTFIDEASGRIEPYTGLYEALTTLEIITSAYRSASAQGATRTVAAVPPP